MQNPPPPGYPAQAASGFQGSYGGFWIRVVAYIIDFIILAVIEGIIAVVLGVNFQDPNSASSQFFIVVKDSPFLDRQYTVFGQVTKGMDVADKIVNAPHGANDRPNSPTTITKVVIRDAKADEKGPTPK